MTHTAPNSPLLDQSEKEKNNHTISHPRQNTRYAHQFCTHRHTHTHARTQTFTARRLQRERERESKKRRQNAATSGPLEKLYFPGGRNAHARGGVKGVKSNFLCREAPSSHSLYARNFDPHVAKTELCAPAREPIISHFPNFARGAFSITTGGRRRTSFFFQNYRAR